MIGDNKCLPLTGNCVAVEEDGDCIKCAKGYVLDNKNTCCPIVQGPGKGDEDTSVDVGQGDKDSKSGKYDHDDDSKDHKKCRRHKRRHGKCHKRKFNKNKDDDSKSKGDDS